MKKKVLTATAACLIIAVVLLSAFCGRKPYKDLQPSDIVSAAVSLNMPDKTIQITEIKELAKYLSKVVIYKEDNSYTEYAGQGVTFTLTMADGTEEEITECSPFAIINGKGYRAKQEPCEKLNSYADRLLDRTE